MLSFAWISYQLLHHGVGHTAAEDWLLVEIRARLFSRRGALWRGRWRRRRRRRATQVLPTIAVATWLSTIAAPQKKKNTVDTPGERGEMLPSQLTLITLCSATLQTSIRGQIYSTPFVSPLFKLRYRPHAIFPRSRLGCHYPRRTKGASSLGSRAAPLGKKWPLSWNWRKNMTPVSASGQWRMAPYIINYCVCSAVIYVIYGSHCRISIL